MVAKIIKEHEQNYLMPFYNTKTLAVLFIISLTSFHLYGFAGRLVALIQTFILVKKLVQFIIYQNGSVGLLRMPRSSL